MNPYRIALANVRFASSPDESIDIAVQAVQDAAAAHAGIVCFPECFVPGLRGVGHSIPRLDALSLERAWTKVATVAGRRNIAVILGTERIVGDQLRATALVVNPDGTIAGYQDKVQLDPSEDDIYSPGSGRRLFQAGKLVFGIAICHEGWRYPETVRWPATQGAHIVFHPHVSEAEPGSFRPLTFADPANTFHEKAALCRAAENTCYFATVNYAAEGSPTTSAIINPDGSVLAWQPYGQQGLLVADIDLDLATRLLATRLRPV